MPRPPRSCRPSATVPRTVAALVALLGPLLLAPTPVAAVTVGDPGPPPPRAEARLPQPGPDPSPRGRSVGGWSSRSWPVEPVAVVAEFHRPDPDWLPGHRGLDLAASPGQLVRAAAAGVVAFAGPVGGRGVIVVATGPWRASYEPLDPGVVAGERVEAGQPIGILAPRAGHCGAPASCLHWGLRAGDRYLDPRWLLVPPRPVLLGLPWRGG